MGGNGAAWTDKPCRADRDVRKVASEHCLEVGAAANIPITENKDASHLAQFQNRPTRARESRSVQETVGQVPRGVIHPLETAVSALRWSRCCAHRCFASIGTHWFNH